MKDIIRRLPLLFAFLVVVQSGFPLASSAQDAHISEARRSILTYPYFEPNPVPILTRDARLYPYHSFQSYTLQPEPRDWTVVTLENDYIQVFVLPEVGGKVWGAIEKSSGHEFIYRNEVLKFRDISLRGPWTSGGIEFNFGVIGHTPSTASPVDYALRSNPDGSVSCFVGAMDLPSRTTWRVEIRLPADKAYFETNVTWSNPTPLTQPYYNWMTAAAFARDDLDVSIPGNQYLRHSGEALPWPIDDEGRLLSSYKENAFGPSKSYHVVGQYEDFFGGYFADAGYGFGHWAPYSDMPGQKLWLWALSRSGGIWEDLLTDTDGQYIEFQAGRMFVQYSAGSHVNPITEAVFEPYATDRWSEIWFPVEGIGGLMDASRSGALAVQMEGDRIRVNINAFEDVTATIQIRQEGRVVSEETFSSRPMEMVSESLAFDPAMKYEVVVPEMDLHYRSDPEDAALQRPFETDPAAFQSLSDADRAVFDGNELSKARRYEDALRRYEAALEIDEWHRDALAGYAEILYRRGDHDAGLRAVNRMLQIDAYDARANFLAGIHYRANGKLTDAKEAFGWASRSMAFRSASNAQLAEIALTIGRYEEAIHKAQAALDYDRYSVNALQVLATAARRMDRPDVWSEAIERLTQLDPIGHFAIAEKFLESESSELTEAVKTFFRGEFPEQSYLEDAIWYANMGQNEDAIRVLMLGDQLAPSQMGRLWLGFLYRNATEDASDTWLRAAAELTIGAPFRLESVPVLEWASRTHGQWRWKYLLALNYWATGQKSDAALEMEALGGTPDYGPFYAARAALMRSVSGRDEESDLRRAVELDPSESAHWQALVQYLQAQERWGDALTATSELQDRYTGRTNFDVLRARSLLNLNRPSEAIDLLTSTQVLPSEGSAGGHTVYEEAHIMAGLEHLKSGAYRRALDFFRNGMEWPENLGAGRPYAPDDRLLQFLIGTAEAKAGNGVSAQAAYRSVVESPYSESTSSTLDHILTILSFRRLGDDAAAEEVMHDLGASNRAGDVPTRWVLSRASGDRAESEQLQTQFPEQFRPLGIRLMLEAIETP